MWLNAESCRELSRGKSFCSWQERLSVYAESDAGMIGGRLVMCPWWWLRGSYSHFLT